MAHEALNLADLSFISMYINKMQVLQKMKACKARKILKALKARKKWGRVSQVKK